MLHSAILRTIALFLAVALLLPSAALAGIGSKDAVYNGGTVPIFKDIKDPVTGAFDLKDEKEFRFVCGKDKKVFAIPYDKFIDLEYGQKAGRRVGAALATALLVSPVGLFLLMSKKRKHFITIGYKDAEGKDQVAVFEMGKDIVRNSLAIIETRSGKKIEYQDKEAEKAGKSGN